MELWILASFAAALFQSVRFMLQKHLFQGALSASGATFARFVYSAPLAVLCLGVYGGLTGHLPSFPDLTFWSYGFVGGAAQILGTVCTVTLLGRRNFAVGLTFIKTEVLLTVVIGFIVLGETLSTMGAVAILLGVAGLLVLSGPVERGHGPIWRRLLSPSAGLGLLAGALFGVAGVCARAASLEVASDLAGVRALITLSAITTMQMTGMAIWMQIRDPQEIKRVFCAWRTALWIGLTSMAGTFCWFTAFTLQKAAYVKAVGQVEIVFGILATVLIFRETIRSREWLGIGLVSLSVLALVLWG
nr:EamA family transporter [uncultured Shimia sp.]